NTGDLDGSDDINQGDAAGGDLSGTFPTPSVVGLQGNPVANTTPNTDQVLKWNGTNWTPAPDESAAYTAGNGINISGNTIENTGDTDASDDITNSSSAGGDLAGTYPNPSVGGLQGNPVSPASPNTSQVLKWNGSSWAPSSDENTTYSAGTGINLAGTTIENTGDTDASDDITTSSSAGGDLSGTFPAPSVIGLQGQPVSSSAPSTGQVLKWNGSSWAPASDSEGSSVWNTSGTNTYYNAGDVGIGTSSMDGRLHIRHNSNLQDPHLWLDENGNDYARLNFQNNNGSADSSYWSIAAYLASNVQNDRFNIWNGRTGDVMTITGDGEVGIGVGISPKVPFHIGNGRRVLFGTDTLGNGDKMMFLPDLHAFRVGTVATGAASTYWNRDSIGLYSFASGLNTRAQGFGATAMGRDTEATNSYAFASGFFTNADGQYSTAMGFNTDAFALGSTALGYSTDAEENYSFAAGYFAEAQAIYSIAIGNAVRAQSFASMAVGRYNVGGGSATSWLSGDPIFEIGIGTGPSSRANAMTVRKNGNVGIGTTVPLDRLHVNGRVRLQTVEYIEDGGTSEIAVRGDLRPSANNTYDIGTSSLRWDDIYATNGTINTSDMRDKEGIEPIPYGLKEVLQLNPVKYRWKNQPLSEPKLGLLAQELLPLIKEVVKTHDFEVSEDDESLTRVELDRLGVYYSDLIPVLIRAAQEEHAIVEKQQAEIDQLKKEMAEIKALLSEKKND
ncbi:MAG: tail fiber domain-containing protein, partial [Bacteroidota bacterium]